MLRWLFLFDGALLLNGKQKVRKRERAPGLYELSLELTGPGAEIFSLRMALP